DSKFSPPRRRSHGCAPSGVPEFCFCNHRHTSTSRGIESAQRVGGSKLCAADGPGVQRLPLRASGTQSSRTKVQAARLRGSRGSDQDRDIGGKEDACRAGSSRFAAPFGMLETSFTATKSPVPATQNGSFEFPQ